MMNMLDAGQTPETVALASFDRIRARLDDATPSGRAALLLQGLEQLTGQSYHYAHLPSQQHSHPIELNSSSLDTASEPLWAAAQSCRQQAEMLAHELRTPMQGIVGTLDIMHHNLQLATDPAHHFGSEDLRGLDADIQTVQESARRAVDAADNIVRAYEMGMGGTEPPSPRQPTEDTQPRRPSLKRRRSDSDRFDEPHSKIRPIAFPITNIRDVLEQIVYDAVCNPADRCLVSRSKLYEYGESLNIEMSSNDGTRIRNTLDWSIEPNVPACIFVHERSFAKAVSCVLNNALKFTNNGSVSLKASLRDGKVCITVTDTGPGIKPSFRPKLFRAFSKEDTGASRTSEGLGLGLLVARGLAEKIGGSLRLLSADVGGPRKGTTFELKVPVSSRAHTMFTTTMLPTPPSTAISGDLHLSASFGSAFTPTPTVSPSAISTSDLETGEKSFPFAKRLAYDIAPTTAGAAPANDHPAKRRIITRLIDPELALKHPLHILVAEDNAINRRLLVGCLSKMGYKPTVSEASDGVEAVRQAETSSSPFDLVLMDLWMPHKDGFEACADILEHSRKSAKRPPSVIAVTADSTEGASERAAAAGMQGVLLKPYVLTDLEKLLVSASEVRAKEAAWHAPPLESEQLGRAMSFS